MVVPLDPFFLVTTGTLRWEGVDDNSFERFHANMHDLGTLGKWDGTLFWRNPSFGAIGPYLHRLPLYPLIVYRAPLTLL